LVAAFFVTDLVALFFAQRAFIAADIAALPFALIFLFSGFVALDSAALGRPGPFFVATPDSNALACCNLDISVSISAMMRFVSMNPPYRHHSELMQYVIRQTTKKLAPLALKRGFCGQLLCLRIVQLA
jgi:hypothetical protein